MPKLHNSLAVLGILCCSNPAYSEVINLRCSQISGSATLIDNVTVDTSAKSVQEIVELPAPGAGRVKMILGFTNGDDGRFFKKIETEGLNTKMSEDVQSVFRPQLAFTGKQHVSIDDDKIDYGVQAGTHSVSTAIDRNTGEAKKSGGKVMNCVARQKKF